MYVDDFTIYTMFPDTTVSLLTTQGFKGQNTVITCGHSITNRASKSDVGSLMLEYGGGGHRAVGTCQVPHERADHIIGELVSRLNSAG